MDELADELSMFGLSISKSAEPLCRMMLDRYKAQDVLNSIVAAALLKSASSIDSSILESVDRQLKMKMQKALARHRSSPQKPEEQVVNLQSNVWLEKQANNVETLMQFNDFSALTKPSRVVVKVRTAECNSLYMADSPKERAKVLNNAIRRVEQAFLAKNADLELHDFRRPSIGTACVCGRVFVSSNADGAKQLYLQGSMQTCGGRSVQVCLDNCQNYSIFPGQVTVCTGTVTDGNTIVVESIIKGERLPIPELAVRHDIDFVVACGPFLTDERDTFEPLQKLLLYCINACPSTLILIGPFVDEDFSSESFEGLFSNFVQLVEQAVDRCPNLRCIFVPSCKDVFCDPIYPQGPMKLDSQAIIEAPDPAFIELDGLSVAVTSADVLFHMASYEQCKGSSENRMSRLVGHILEQRSFYPLFPPSQDLPLDLGRWEKLCRIDDTPNVIILPSDLVHFIKTYPEVSGDGECVFVNPGRMVKRKSFARNSFAHIGLSAKKGSKIFGRILHFT